MSKNFSTSIPKNQLPLSNKNRDSGDEENLSDEDDDINYILPPVDKPQLRTGSGSSGSAMTDKNQSNVSQSKSYWNSMSQDQLPLNNKKPDSGDKKSSDKVDNNTRLPTVDQVLVKPQLKIGGRSIVSAMSEKVQSNLSQPQLKIGGRSIISAMTEKGQSNSSQPQVKFGSGSSNSAMEKNQSNLPQSKSSWISNPKDRLPPPNKKEVLSDEELSDEEDNKTDRLPTVEKMLIKPPLKMGNASSGSATTDKSQSNLSKPQLNFGSASGSATTDKNQSNSSQEDQSSKSWNAIPDDRLAAIAAKLRARIEDDSDDEEIFGLKTIQEEPEIDEPESASSSRTMDKSLSNLSQRTLTDRIEGIEERIEKLVTQVEDMAKRNKNIEDLVFRVAKHNGIHHSLDA